MACAKAFLDEADIVVTPGVGFGKSGEGYVRMSLTLPVERIHEAVQRLEKVLAVKAEEVKPVEPAPAETGA